jgi:hypothetical protein
MNEPFLKFMAQLARQGFTPPREKTPGNAGTAPAPPGPRRPISMRTELTATTDSSDGWRDAADEAGERVIKGTLLKFSDWNWFKGKEGTKIEEGYKLVALDTAAAWVKWRDSKPVEYKMRQPGRKLPDRDDLGDDDESQWETGPDDNPKDPGKTPASFTWSTR